MVRRLHLLVVDRRLCGLPGIGRAVEVGGRNRASPRRSLGNDRHFVGSALTLVWSGLNTMPPHSNAPHHTSTNRDVSMKVRQSTSEFSQCAWLRDRHPDLAEAVFGGTVPSPESRSSFREWIGKGDEPHCCVLAQLGPTRGNRGAQVTAAKAADAASLKAIAPRNGGRHPLYCTFRA